MILALVGRGALWWTVAAAWLVVASCGAMAQSMSLAGMASAEPDARLKSWVDAAVAEAAAQPGKLRVPTNDIAVTLVDLDDPAAPRWASHRGSEAIYPASVVKLFYLVAAHRWLEEGKLAESAELDRAMRDMIVDSSNDATHYVVDVLTGTTSGPELAPDELRAWHSKRGAVNRYFAPLGYTGINCDKKPWGDGPYGRESQAIRAFEPKRNMLTTDATARLMTEIALDRAGTPARCARMRGLLSRDFTAAATPEDQVHGFVGSALTPGMKLWSKAGWTSQTRHDAALVELPGGHRVVLVVFTENHATDEQSIPRVARSVLARIR